MMAALSQAAQLVIRPRTDQQMQSMPPEIATAQMLATKLLKSTKLTLFHTFLSVTALHTYRVCELRVTNMRLIISPPHLDLDGAGVF